VREVESAGRVIELTSIIALDTPDGVTKLGGPIGGRSECGECVRLMA
jgi:hypothetical protein